MNDMAIWVKPHTVHHERCKTSGAPKFRPLKKKKKKVFGNVWRKKKKWGVILARPSPHGEPRSTCATELNCPGSSSNNVLPPVKDSTLIQ